MGAFLVIVKNITEQTRKVWVTCHKTALLPQKATDNLN